jgi:hypothetical protein
VPDWSGVEKPILSPTLAGPVLGPAGGVITKLTVMDWLVVVVVVLEDPLEAVPVDDGVEGLLIVIVPEQSGFTE